MTTIVAKSKLSYEESINTLEQLAENMGLIIQHGGKAATNWNGINCHIANDDIFCCSDYHNSYNVILQYDNVYHDFVIDTLKELN